MMTLPTPPEQFESGIVVTRYIAGSTEKGRWIDGTPTTFTVTASIQPAPMEELVNFPEGERTREFVMIFTETQLKTVDEINGTKADQFTWRGFDYEIRRVSPWQMGALDHYQCLAARVNP